MTNLELVHAPDQCRLSRKQLELVHENDWPASVDGQWAKLNDQWMSDRQCMASLK